MFPSIESTVKKYVKRRKETFSKNLVYFSVWSIRSRFFIIISFDFYRLLGKIWDGIVNFVKNTGGVIHYISIYSCSVVVFYILRVFIIISFSNIVRKIARFCYNMTLWNTRIRYVIICAQYEQQFFFVFCFLLM